MRPGALHDDPRFRSAPYHASRIVIGILFLAAYGGLSVTKVTLAAVEDSRFEYSADGDTADFLVKDVPRREVLERLFAGTDIELKWLSSSFGEESVSGKFIGSRAAVARQLLQDANFIIGYDGQSRLVRLIIVGSAGGAARPSTLAALTDGLQRNENSASTGATDSLPAVDVPQGWDRNTTDAAHDCAFQLGSSE